MDCASIERDEIIERYLKPGALSAEEAQAFEQHYFACSSCFELLEAARIAQDALTAKSNVVALKARPNYTRWFAIAACLVAAALAGYWVNTRVDRSPQVAQKAPVVPQPVAIAQLARYEVPKYDEGMVRGQSSSAEAAFRDAMKPYAATDYETARRRLREVASTHPDYSPAYFFLGACELLLHQPDAAVADMMRVLTDQETPFREEAQWAMAQAYLLKNDADRAKDLLKALAASGGDLAPQAADLLRKLGN